MVCDPRSALETSVRITPGAWKLQGRQAGQNGTAVAVAGVRSAAVSSVRVLTGGGTSSGMIAINDGQMTRIRPTLWMNGTTPGWFQAMSIPLRSGRDRR
jgi:hypothetical protein